MSDRPLVVYYRASTRRQKRSGLGLLAQQDSVRRYIQANPGRVIGEVTEIESGRSKDRPIRRIESADNPFPTSAKAGTRPEKIDYAPRVALFKTSIQ
jgi:hypothetical protein